MATDASKELQEAAIIGVLEVLINPEYSFRWLNEILEDEGVQNITDEVTEEVDTLMTERFKALAVSLLPELSEEKRSKWAETLK